MGKKWSDELIELSEEYLNYSGSRVKSLLGEQGILDIDYDNKLYYIHISNSEKILTFNSIQQIIDDGWAVD